MPRTKQTRKKSVDGAEDGGLLLKDFEKQVNLRLGKMQSNFETQIQRVDARYQIALSRYPQSIIELTLREILQLDAELAENVCEVSSSVNDDTVSPQPKTVKAKKYSKRTTATSDDGYMTEGGTTTSTTNQNSLAVPTTTRKIRTRSSSADRRVKLSEIQQVPKTVKKVERLTATAVKNKFKTPAMSKTRLNEYALVTPKVKPNTPLSVMRRPRQGEMALSMQGSPLLVTSVVNENVANVNVPLDNGRVLSLLPNDGLRLSYLPEFDDETRRQLLTLKQHLDKVIGSS
ncbi:borealin [Athalia rosae]|uniref:borealin n=1 Tax=Athalia rosae TaxID=37344 RepID=UPI002033D4E3|nr:borealin [Athalia rosae]